MITSISARRLWGHTTSIDTIERPIVHVPPRESIRRAVQNWTRRATDTTCRPAPARCLRTARAPQRPLAQCSGERLHTRGNDVSDRTKWPRTSSTRQACASTETAGDRLSSAQVPCARCRCPRGA
ncbi:uncharacterized protein TRAVEDRAFT_59095 [Trametes versicolor FP-101664 SS1]|uniref:uncharacterized protein n=1 Tax=Trametes versicolor (strain FP-101664) TaxID=717944 RepID=UPI0004623A88|nr:uncharacterized protein TRAVEDRAFT_59095 [Trametes versicolor FP-101664 SS1]EIW57382.1 hypothetical protein TRAVEDRAFT_59095 [Trametes versicolor FP-101664 SS1]